MNETDNELMLVLEKLNKIGQFLGCKNIERFEQPKFCSAHRELIGIWVDITNIN